MIGSTGVRSCRQERTVEELEREALQAEVRDGLEAYAARIRDGRVELAARIGEAENS